MPKSSAGRGARKASGSRKVAAANRPKTTAAKAAKPAADKPPAAKPPGGKEAARNVALITRFYDAFGRCDAERMIACYAPDATFSDPVFDRLDHADLCAMWRMLCANAKDLQIKTSGIDADASAGRAHWTARYTYSATGRPVINQIDAVFRFRDGKIASHQDTFDLWRWSRQALGPVGWMVGLPGLRRAIRQKAKAALKASRAKADKA